MDGILQITSHNKKESRHTAVGPKAGLCNLRPTDFVTINNKL